MTAIKALQKRLDRLEDRPTNEPDLVEMVLEALSDDDLDLLQEQASLRDAGFDDEQISVMMAERWSLFQQAVERFKQVTIELESDYKQNIERGKQNSDLTLSKIRSKPFACSVAFAVDASRGGESAT